jgi:hypothetical protein
VFLKNSLARSQPHRIFPNEVRTRTLSFYRRGPICRSANLKLAGCLLLLGRDRQDATAALAEQVESFADQLQTNLE